MNIASDINVSVAEVCEVRGSGLDSSELLALAASAADSLPPCPVGTVFDPDNVSISDKGRVVIKTVQSTTVEKEFVPPEWKENEDNEIAAAVYCLGAVMRACGADDVQDVALTSLVNIMTVGHVKTRPTANRTAQMARNQLKGKDPRSILIQLYEEIMGDEESNQLPEDMEYDDLGIEDERSASSVGMTKKATVFDDDDKDGSRGASASTSSGNSTQKDESPFDDEIEEEEIIEHRVPSPVPPPRSPKHFGDEMMDLGSPIGNSTRLNETYIEEHSIKSFDVNNLSPMKMHSTPIKTSVTTITSTTSTAGNTSDHLNPFDEDDEDEGLKGTLSGRDPFENELSPQKSASLKKMGVQVFPAAASASHTKVGHRFSNSSDEIVEVQDHSDDEELFKPKGKVNYFNDVVEKEQPKPSQPVIVKKEAVPVDDFESSSSGSCSSSDQEEHENTPPPVVAPARHRYDKRRPSNADLDRLREQTDNVRAMVAKISDEQEEREENMAGENIKRHVDAVVITEPPPPPAYPPRTNGRPKMERSDSENSIDAAFNEALKAKKPAVTSPAPLAQDSPRLNRRNSLVPARVSGRQSKRNSLRGKRKTRALPEFYDNTRHPSIRLKAPSAKKKKMTLMRVEQTEVLVELLNGQRIEVSCRTDAIARDIFSLVVQHMNINEHIFFGLCFNRDNEYFFVDDHQRLEKYAPPGWKAGLRAPQRTQFVLFLRFRFYPQILDFIKTDITMHELYLQVRHDVIDDRIQPKRDSAFELAALALQAEFGNSPPTVITDYFDNQHYLSKRYCNNDDPKRLQQVLAEYHAKQSGVVPTDAEHKFIQICQKHREFGGHLHRVFRNKPSGSVGAAPFDPDTGAALWISIMPRGIAVYEEQGGLRQELSEHVWPETQTLQFDKKKFVIVASRDGMQTEAIFYTDHHTKSSYFVKFSASQHRFMMKMRQWKTTLRHDATIQSMPDVCVEGHVPHSVPSPSSHSPLDEAPDLFARMPATTTVTARENAVLDVSIPSQDRSIRPADESVNASLLERFEAASTPDDNGEYPGMHFNVTLHKNPTVGLGLTLVDGNLNNVRGVYVKSVAENGAGMKAGLCVGDRILSIDGKSLEGGDRHLAVDYVKACTNEVHLEIARLDGVIRHEKAVSRDSADVVKKSSSASNNGLVVPATSKGGSRTPPAPRKAANRRQRAVSDFGAIGDMLPALDSENVLDIKAISGLHLDESDEERGEFHLPVASMYLFDQHDDEDLPNNSSYNNRSKSDIVSPTSRDSTPSTTSDAKRKPRYARKSNLDWTEELEEVEEEEIVYVTLERNSMGSLGVQIASVAGRVCVKQLTAPPAAGHPDIKVGMQLVDVNGQQVSGCSHQEVVSMLRSGGSTVVLGLKKEPAAEEDNINIVLNKLPDGSLGISLAKRTGTDGIFIRTIAEGSAAASEGSLQIGDRLLSFDGQSVEGLSPTTILAKLKVIQGPIRMTVSRQAT